MIIYGYEASIRNEILPLPQVVLRQYQTQCGCPCKHYPNTVPLLT